MHEELVALADVREGDGIADERMLGVISTLQRTDRYVSLVRAQPVEVDQVDAAEVGVAADGRVAHRVVPGLLGGACLGGGGGVRGVRRDGW